MKKRNAKALEPSEMGLHSRVRFVIQPQGNNRTEQMRDIIDRAVFLFYAVCPLFCPDSIKRYIYRACANMGISQSRRTLLNTFRSIRTLNF